MSSGSEHFVCAICSPSAARPASITCVNGCGRHVCVDHARAINPALHGPMVCLECWERVYLSGRQELLGKSAPHVDDAAAWFRGMVDSGHLPAPRTRRFSRLIVLAATVVMLLTGLAMLIMIMNTR